MTMVIRMSPLFPLAEERLRMGEEGRMIDLPFTNKVLLYSTLLVRLQRHFYPFIFLLYLSYLSFLPSFPGYEI